MKTYSFRMMDGSTVPITANSPDEARAKAREYQAMLAAGKAERGWDVGRMAGLAGRAGVEGMIEGAGTLASLPADALYNVGVAGMKGLDYLAGSDTAPDFAMPVTGMVTGAANAAGDAFGLPEPETDNERLAMSAAKGALSAIPGLGIGSALSAGSGAVRTVGNILRAAPVTQTAAGAAAGGAGELMMQQTGNPALAIGAGLIGGTATSAGMAAGQGALTALRPLTAGGRDRIVGDVLNMQANNPQRAIRNMETAPTYVPGSKPLAGVASGDYGLINLQRGAERLDTRRMFAQNIEDANQARNDRLAAVTLNPSQVDAMSKARTAKADVDTAALFDTPQMKKLRVPLNDLMRNLNTIKAEERTFARLPVQEALKAAQNQILSAAKLNRKTGQHEINPGVLYSIRQNLAEAMSGRIRSDDLPNIKLAGGTGSKILDMIDDKIETVAPGFKAYMADLAQSGEARKQGSLGYEAYQAGMSSGPTAVNGGAPFLNLSSLRRAYEQRKRDLSANQRQAFEAVIMDLDRSMKTTAPSIRSSGSDTMQNLSVAALMGRAFGGEIGQGAVGTALAKPLNWFIGLGNIGTPAAQDRLVEALADPAIAAALMRKATPGNVEYAGSLLNKVVQGSRNTGQSTAAASQSWVVEDADGNRYDANGRLVQ